jgi:hypothetical protein
VRTPLLAGDRHPLAVEQNKTFTVATINLSQRAGHQARCPSGAEMRPWQARRRCLQTSGADPKQPVIALRSGRPAACLLTFIQSCFDTSHDRRARRIEWPGLTVWSVPAVSPFLVNEDAVAPPIYAVHLI